MTVDWSVPTPMEFDPDALRVRLSQLLEPILTIELSWYALDGAYPKPGAYLRGDRSPQAPPTPTENNAVVLGDHANNCNITISTDFGEFGPGYRVSPMRNLVSWVVALLAAGCTAELTGAQVFDDPEITGRRLLAPAELLAPVRALRRHDGETMESTLIRIADAVGAPTLANPWRP
ncbi:hypothetical protein AB0H83_29310 [Dactylosporangium sp. NPDC050688]|uniref:hypothetical protein n=1 Tax=Dactylosporangium sp. NPDC050688 TaxID=3157217 RepID=UPI0033D16AC2